MIRVSNLTIEIFGNPLFENISFTLHRKDKVGLIGPNGSGKTTILKCLLKEIEPDKGSLKIEHERIGYLSQATVEESEGSIGEYLGIKDPEKIKRGLKKVGLEKLSHDQEVSVLSGGQKTRLAMAKVLLLKPTFLLLDEPTNNLDKEGLIWIETFIKEFKGGVLLVSHDRRLLDNTVQKLFEIDGLNNSFREFAGGYSEYAIEKDRLMEKQEDEFQRQQAKERRMKLWLVRKREEAKIYDDPAKGKQIRAMERRMQREIYDNKVEKPRELNSLKGMGLSGKVHTGKLMLRVKEVEKSYEEKKVHKGLSFEVRGKDHVLLSGANGSGKSTILKMVVGEKSPDTGDVEIGENVTVGYFAQEHDTLDPEKTVLQEFESTERLIDPRKSPRKILGSFLFKDATIAKRVGSLSFGERVRLTFAKLTQQKNELLLLDEPTNHLDIPSREAIEDALIEYQGAVLVVSHDRYFLDRIGVDREIAIQRGKAVEKFDNLRSSSSTTDDL